MRKGWKVRGSPSVLQLWERSITGRRRTRGPRGEAAAGHRGDLGRRVRSCSVEAATGEVI